MAAAAEGLSSETFNPRPDATLDGGAEVVGESGQHGGEGEDAGEQATSATDPGTAPPEPEEGQEGQEGEEEEASAGYCFALIAYVNEQPDGELTLDQAVFLMTALAHADVSTHEGLVKSNAVPALLVCFQRAAVDPQAQEWGCTAIWNLATTKENELALVEAGAVEVLAGAMPTAGDTTATSLLERCCGALASLTCSEAGQAAVMECGAHQGLLGALRADGASWAARKWAAAALAYVCSGDEEQAEALLEAQALQTCIRVLQAGADLSEEAACEACTFLLMGLTSLLELPAARAAAFEHKLHPPVIQILGKDKIGTEGLENAAALVATLTLGSSDAARPAELAALSEAGAEAGLQAAMQGQTSAGLHASGHQALSALSAGYLGSVSHWLRAQTNGVFSVVLGR